MNTTTAHSALRLTDPRYAVAAEHRRDLLEQAAAHRLASAARAGRRRRQLRLRLTWTQIVVTASAPGDAA